MHNDFLEKVTILLGNYSSNSDQGSYVRKSKTNGKSRHRNGQPRPRQGLTASPPLGPVPLNAADASGRGPHEPAHVGYVGAGVALDLRRDVCQLNVGVQLDLAEADP